MAHTHRCAIANMVEEYNEEVEASLLATTHECAACFQLKCSIKSGRGYPLLMSVVILHWIGRGDDELLLQEDDCVRRHQDSPPPTSKSPAIPSRPHTSQNFNKNRLLCIR